jgi:hypothetical protein
MTAPRGIEAMFPSMLLTRGTDALSHEDRVLDKCVRVYRLLESLALMYWMSGNL